MKHKHLPFIIRILLLPFLGPIIIAGSVWSALSGFGIHIAGGLLGCPFPLPFIMCHVCPVLCAFGLIRSWLIRSIILTSVLFGRVFCGLVCPCGTIQDLFHKILPQRVSVDGANSVDGLLRYVKYGALILFAGLVLELTRMGPRIPFVDNLLLFMITYDEELFVIGWVVVVTVLASSTLMSRPWCRYLCPLGALLSISNKISVLLIKRDPKKCIECGACEHRCLMGLTLVGRRDATSSTECIRCLECYTICKRNAWKFRIRSVVKTHSPLK